MKYYYCLASLELGMEACGLSNGATSRLEVAGENETITMTDIPYATGNTCYFDLTSNDSWTNTSLVHIYPSEMTNVNVYIANGTSRLMAQEFYTDITAEKDYFFAPGQSVYLVVAPSLATNGFTFKYSISGEIDVPTKLWEYLKDGENGYLWVFLGISIVAVLICIYCVFKYFSQRQPLRKNKNLAL